MLKMIIHGESEEHSVGEHKIRTDQILFCPVCGTQTTEGDYVKLIDDTDIIFKLLKGDKQVFLNFNCRKCKQEFIGFIIEEDEND